VKGFLTRPPPPPQDDAYVEVPLGFSFNYFGLAYSSVFVGSNAYVTFGSGSTAFSGLSNGIANTPGVFVAGADNSFVSATASTRLPATWLISLHRCSCVCECHANG
jgi:hypothetical protein